LHLGDVALMEHDSAHQLHVEHALVGLAQSGLAHGRVGLEEQVLERFAVPEPFPELDRLRPELAVRELLELRLERGDVRSLLDEALHPPALAEAEGLLERASDLGHPAQGTGRRSWHESRPDPIRTALERRLVDLPEVAVDPAGPDDVLRALERRHAAEGALAV